MTNHSPLLDGTRPRLSVIVPVRSNTPELRECLAALEASDLPRQDWELIVVTSERDEDAWLGSALHADTIVRLPDGPWGAAYARNRGVEISRAPYLLFVSADVCVTSDALSGFLEVLDLEQDVGAVCGTYVHDSRFIRTHAAAYQNLVHQFRSEYGAGVTDTFSAGFGAIRRELFLDAGMFDEWRVEVPRIEDAEFGRRLLRLGYQVVVRPHLRAAHLKQWTLWRTLGQSIRDPGIPWHNELGTATNRVINPGLRAVRRIETAGILFVWSALVAGAIRALGGDGQGRTGILVFLILSTISCLPICFFAARRRSVRFALTILPIHLARLLVTGIGIGNNWIIRHLIGEPRPSPAVEAFAEVGISIWPPIPRRRPLRELATRQD